MPIIFMNDDTRLVGIIMHFMRMPAGVARHTIAADAPKVDVMTTAA